MRPIPLIVSLLVPALALLAAAQDQPRPPAVPERNPTPQDAYLAAEADLRTLTKFDTPFIRYVWVWTNQVEDLKATSLAVNFISRVADIAQPLPLKGPGRMLLARIDLRNYVSKDKDLKEWLALWEELQFDPKFSLLLTRNILQHLVDPDALKVRKRVVERKKVGTRWVKKPVLPYVATDGKTYDWEDEEITIFAEAGSFVEVAVKDIGDADVVRLASEAIDPRLTLRLIELTGSQAPVVSFDYFLSRVLSTIKDGRAVKEDKIYKTIYGGLYYEFSGTPLAGEKGTDEDALFEQLGVGNIAAGVTARQVYDRVRTDRRAARFRSEVTGKPRQAEFLRVPGGAQVGDGIGIISVTHDPFDEDIDVDQDPVLNLLDFVNRDRAREVIYERANGLQGYVLFNGAGKRQDEVPFNVAMDSTIPAPYTQRLQPAIGCIRCHAKEDGWKPFPNEVKAMARSRFGPDVLADLTEGKAEAKDTLQRLTALYRGEPEPFLREARGHYMRAFLAAAGPWKQGAADQTEVVRVGSARIADVWGNRWYKTVDAAQALREMGYPAEKGKELETFNALLLPDLRSAVFGVLPEDGRVGGLKAGLSLGRVQFDLSFSVLAARAARTTERLKEKR